MGTPLSNWIASERTFLQEDLKWMKAGAKLLSPSGENISDKRISDLKARIEHASQMLTEVLANEADDAS